MPTDKEFHEEMKANQAKLKKITVEQLEVGSGEAVFVIEANGDAYLGEVDKNGFHAYGHKGPVLNVNSPDFDKQCKQLGWDKINASY